MQIKIFIINLDKSIERKSFIEQQFSELNKNNSSQIGYQFFQAINGKENPNFYLFKKYNHKERMARKGNSMNFSQLGCFASHYLLWEKCVKEDTPMIILEDDAIIKPDFIDVYKFISSKQNKYNFFWLGEPALTRKNQQNKPIFHFGNHTLSQVYGKWGNTTGYFITPHSAKKLLSYTEEWIYEVDITMERYWENKLEYLAIIPFCITANLDLESNIPVDKGKKDRTLMIKLKREYYNLKDKFFKLIYNIKR